MHGFIVENPKNHIEIKMSFHIFPKSWSQKIQKMTPRGVRPGWGGPGWGPYGPMWALMGPYGSSWTGLGKSVNFPSTFRKTIWTNFACFGSENGILMKFLDDSASFLLEKLKNHVILTKNPNI